jgi:hypothetical protein
MFDTYGTTGGFRESRYNIIDHVSMSYGIDSIVWAGDYSLTSNNIIAYGLRNSFHPKSYDYRPIEGNTDCANQYSGGEHSKGMGAQDTVYTTIVKNLFAFNNDRNPYVRNSQHIYIANNMMYGTKDFKILYSADYPDTAMTAIGNVAKGNSPYVFDHFLTVDDIPTAGSMVYLYDNLCDTDHQTDPNIWTCVRYWGGGTGAPKVTSPVDTLGEFTPISANQSESYIENNVGAFPAFRDQADIDLVNHMKNRTGNMINRPEDIPNPFPALTEHTRTLGTGMTSSVGPMPSSPHSDSDNDGYTNLHEWLLCLACEVEGRSCSGC